MQNNEISKNPEAKRICGMRGEGKKKGTPLFFPCELGYVCPICGECGEFLDFSEYNTFLWCRKCNIDIPSCLCKKYPSPKIGKFKMTKRQTIQLATEIYLQSVEDVRNRKVE